MKLFINYLKNYKGLLVAALILAAINQFFSLLDPQIYRLLIDDYALKATELTQNEFLNGVLLLMVAYVAVAFISRTAKTFQNYYVNVIVQKFGTKLYADAVEHSFSLPFSVFEDQRSGEILQKMQKARLDSQKLILNGINIVFVSLVGILFVLGYAYYVHWQIGLAYTLIMPTIGITVAILSRKIKQAQNDIVEEMANLSGSTTETLRNVELVKSLGLEDQEVKRLNRVNDQILNLELIKVKIVRWLDFIQGTMLNALRSGLVLLMLWLIFQEAITVGEYFALFVYSFFIFNPLSNFGEVVASYQEARASMEQLETVFKLPPKEKPQNPKSVDKLENLKFEDVSFQYNSSEKSVLSNIHVEAKAGETIAFAGPSGSGKTTIVKLLAGLYTPKSGKLTFNNTDTEQIDFEAFRRRIGLVSQDTQLFAGTIRENLTFVRPNATDKECIEALEAAAAHSLLERAENGLDTKIGEGGMKISGGEKQRLAIARALLREPELIIFDEATSSLDSMTELEITETIRSISEKRKNLITILVAHRLSTIAHADRIYVMERGRVVEKGSHDQLLKKQGLYSALWREQIAAKS